MANDTLYRGISFRNFSKNKSIKLYDVELIKKGILNNIFTRRGERVKMFMYGTRIPDIIFEPLDDVSLGIIEEDIQMVVSNEPRVTLLSAQIIPRYDQGEVIVNLNLLYLELDFTDQLSVRITFEA